MSLLDIIGETVKKDPTKHYRMIRNNPDRVAGAKMDGFHVVTAADTAVKGTPVEELKGAGGEIRLGESILVATSKARAEELTKKRMAKAEQRLHAVHEAWQETGEALKRAAGNKHKAINVFVEKEEEG